MLPAVGLGAFPWSSLELSSINIVSWNCATLFYALSSQMAHGSMKAAQTMSWVQKIAENSDVVLLQETHGHDGDIVLLRKALPGFGVWASFDTPISGGVITCISERILRHSVVSVCYAVAGR